MQQKKELRTVRNPDNPVDPKSNPLGLLESVVALCIRRAATAIRPASKTVEAPEWQFASVRYLRCSRCAGR